MKRRTYNRRSKDVSNAPSGNPDPKPKKTARLTLRLTPELLDEIHESAAILGFSPNHLSTEILREQVEPFTLRHLSARRAQQDAWLKRRQNRHGK